MGQRSDQDLFMKISHEQDLDAVLKDMPSQWWTLSKIVTTSAVFYNQNAVSINIAFCL